MHDIRKYIKLPFEEPGALLYIGARPDACSWLTELYKAGNVIDILEIWKPNVDELENDPRVHHISQGDVRDLQVDEDYDYIWWWHGPEHLPWVDFMDTMPLLKVCAKRLLAVAAPWGDYPQGQHEGNPSEQHRWSAQACDFSLFGLTVIADGIYSRPGSELVGWIST